MSRIAEIHCRLYELVSEAVAPHQVVWAPFDGQRCKYPWVALQLVSGPDMLRIDKRVGQPLSLNLTVQAGTVGDTVSARVGCVWVSVNHTGDVNTTAEAFEGRLLQLCPDLSITRVGNELQISGGLLLWGEAADATVMGKTDVGNPVEYITVRHEYVFQVTAFAREPRAWLETGALRTAKKAWQRLRRFRGEAERLSFHPRAMLQNINFPPGKAYSETQVLFEVAAAYTEPVLYTEELFTELCPGNPTVGRL